jgi:hypothetical protein
MATVGMMTLAPAVAATPIGAVALAPAAPRRSHLRIANGLRALGERRRVGTGRAGSVTGPADSHQGRDERDPGHSAATAPSPAES